MITPEFEFEIDQDNSTLVEEAAQNFVYAQRRRINRFEFLFGRPSEQQRMVGGYQRVVERVGLVVVLDHGTLERLALLAPQPLRHRAGNDISHYSLDRDYLEPLAEHLAIVEPAHEMRLDAVFFEQREEQLGHPIVDHAFVLDRATLLGVERGRVVLEIGNHEVRVGGRIEFLRLALVEHLVFHLSARLRCRRAFFTFSPFRAAPLSPRQQD